MVLYERHITAAKVLHRPLVWQCHKVVRERIQKVSLQYCLTILCKGLLQSMRLFVFHVRVRIVRGHVSQHSPPHPNLDEKSS